MGQQRRVADNSERRRDAFALTDFASEVLTPTPHTFECAALLQKPGFATFDALHLATAEQGRVDVFLTTHDQLLRLATRFREKLGLRVLNPVSWCQEELS